MNGYTNKATYFFALHYLDYIQEIHLDNRFETYRDLESYCMDMLEEFDNSKGWYHDVIQHEIYEIDFIDLFEKLENE